MSQNLSYAAVVIGALRVNSLYTGSPLMGTFTNGEDMMKCCILQWLSGRVLDSCWFESPCALEQDTLQQNLS